MPNTENFDGIWISREILDLKHISIRERMILAMKECDIEWKNYNELGNFLSVQPDTAYRCVLNLQRLGYLKTIKMSKEEIVSTLKNKKNNNNSGIGDLECEWCGTKTLVLHEHHYPTPNAEGGKEIVNICPNCHQEFHYLENRIKVVK